MPVLWGVLHSFDEPAHMLLISTLEFLLGLVLHSFIAQSYKSRRPEDEAKLCIVCICLSWLKWSGDLLLLFLVCGYPLPVSKLTQHKWKVSQPLVLWLHFDLGDLSNCFSYFTTYSPLALLWFLLYSRIQAGFYYALNSAMRLLRVTRSWRPQATVGSSPLPILYETSKSLSQA